MYNYSLKTQVSFEAAHRLYDVNTYSEECRTNLHGHSYKVTVYVGNTQILNDAGMVVDFKQIKQIIKSCIEDKYDHSCILKSNDPLCKPISENCKKVIIVDENPTAEWMAHEFCIEINSAIPDELQSLHVFRIEVQETENNIAIYEVK